jgi:hypothetical protein
MYVRETKIRRGIGTWDDPIRVYSYWQVVKSYRDPDTGKVRKRVVAHLGKAKDRDEAYFLARAKGVLCGAMGCNEPATVDLADRRFHATWTVSLPDSGDEREYPYRVCPAHLDGWKAGERLRGVPVLYPDSPTRIA